ncbi:ATP-binding cassette domain-containing protein [Haloechinothrix sp. LS1_15]|uniref:ATP-binding cassette domain-containing protein n=1 Tax=Haloechinothrix sp. LS1_15 TaxID=2652248 RepID=UPI00294657E0|nr:ATP-binding cassette domain-containing protein [Haloechinothrix sp. LS1_15]MDV6011265.1 ATP-binding cassette domain-containing protein [Haloechinothrix sp. LS1_15]
MAEESAFAIEGVLLRLGGRAVLDRVSLDVAARRCTALVGRSGSGKSTLLRVLTRLAEPEAGSVRYRGVPLPEWDVLDLRRRVQLVTQHPVLLADTVAEEIAAGTGPLPEERVAGLVTGVGLDAGMASRRTAGLSSGEAQRVCLARALAMEPDTLLLDEPTAALDSHSAAAIERAVEAQLRSGVTVLLVSHAVEQVLRLADHAAVLEGGCVTASGPPTELHYLEEP